jgi:ATP-dependent Clp protease ATP-binding subunit ClpC
MIQMFDRFSEPAIKVIMLAQEESRRSGHNFVGTEHILLGLIGVGGIHASSVTLRGLGINLKNARSEVEKLIGRGSGLVAVEIPFTERAKAVLEMALNTARELDHSYVGSEHLLLGIVLEGESISAEMDRAPSPSMAFQVLQNLGVDPSSIRDRVRQAPGFGAERLPEPSEFSTELTELIERFSLQPYQEQLRAMLPPMGDRALKVWHAIGSRTSWAEPDAILDRSRLRNMTGLTDPEIQAALDELIALGVITRTEID